MGQRILYSLMYAITTTAGAAAASGFVFPQTWEAWVGFGLAFLVTFWGKFSTNTRPIAMDRIVWTEQARKDAALADLNKGL